MVTPAVIFLMIANVMAASGAIFAASQISSFSDSRKPMPAEANGSKDGAGEADLTEDHELRKAA